jgi:hypothetical protein
MNLPAIFNRASKQLQLHSPELLTAAGVSGVVTTSYLVGRASYEASKIIEADEGTGGVAADRKQRMKERVSQVWRLYIPATASGVVTIVCIVGASKASGRRTTAAIGAYSLTELAFSEYKEKVVEQLGVGKEKQIRDDLAKEKVTRYPTSSREIIIVGGGHVLCCELYTHRYFRSDMETLRKAMNDINAKIVNDPYVTLDEFYELIELPYTSNSSHVGWDSDKLLALEFTTAMADGGEPCLAFEYNYLKPIK